jgi:hypothetical protein
MKLTKKKIKILFTFLQCVCMLIGLHSVLAGLQSPFMLAIEDPKT